MMFHTHGDGTNGMRIKLMLLWTHCLTTACVVAALAVLSGCGSKPWFGDVLKQRNSYDIRGEDTTITMLDQAAINQFKLYDTEPTDAQLKSACDGAAKDLAAIVARERPKTVTESAAVAGALLPLLAGFAVDAVKADLESEADIFEAQFDSTLYAANFWQN